MNITQIPSDCQNSTLRKERGKDRCLYSGVSDRHSTPSIVPGSERLDQSPCYVSLLNENSLSSTGTVYITLSWKNWTWSSSEILGEAVKKCSLNLIQISNMTKKKLSEKGEKTAN